MLLVSAIAGLSNIQNHQARAHRFITGWVGDGLGPGDYRYKWIKKIFASRLCQWLFARLHPNFGIALANSLSAWSRSTTKVENIYFGDDKEWLLLYANQKLDEVPADYFVFGHRHLPIDRTLKNGKSRYVNLGEWMNFNSYAVFDGNDLSLAFYKNPEGRVFP